MPPPPATLAAFEGGQTVRALRRLWRATLRPALRVALLLALSVLPARSLAAEPLRDTAAAGLLDLARRAAATGQHEQAHERFDSALRQLRTEFGPRHPDALAAQAGLVAALDALGRSREAVSLAEELLGLRRALQGDDHPDTLAAMSLLATALGSDGRVAESLALDQQVLELRRRTQGDDHDATIEAMLDVAHSLGEVGRHDEQHALNERAVALWLARKGERDPDTLTALNNLAVSTNQVGRPEQALVLARRVLALRRELLGDEHPDTEVSLGNLAHVLAESGRADESAMTTRRVYEARRKRLGDTHPSTLLSLNNLSAALAGAGRLSEALQGLQRLHEAWSAMHGEAHPDSLLALSNLAVVSHRLGQSDSAIAYARRAYELRLRSSGPRHPLTLLAMGNLALALGGDADRAAERLALQQQVLQLQTEVNGPDHPQTLIAVNNLLAGLADAGRHTEASALAAKGLATAQRVLGASHPRSLQLQHNLSDLLSTLGRHVEAADHAEAALEGRRQSLGPRHPDTLQSMLRAARARQALGQLEPALSLAAPFVEGAEALRQQVGLSADQRQTLFGPFAAGYRFFALRQAAAGRVAEAWQLAELGKARTLLEGLGAVRAARGGALPAAQQQALDDLGRQIATYRQRAAAAPAAAARAALEQRRDALSREHEALHQRLAAEYPRFAALQSIKLLQAHELAGRVPVGTVAINWVVSGDEVLALVVDTQGQVSRHQGLPLPGLTELVELIRRAQAWPGPLTDLLAARSQRLWAAADGSLRLRPATAVAAPNELEVHDLDRLGRHLADRLLGPLRSALAGASRWLLSPDGALAQLPFEALPWAGGRVVDHVEIVRTPSMSVHALARQLQDAHARRQGRRTLLALGNPRYGDAVAAAARSPRSPGGAPVLPGRIEQLGMLDTLWAPLPGSEAEVRAVQALVGRDADILLGTEASESRLQALDARGELARYRWLLFAAHGWVSPTQPALSAIVLSLHDRSESADGYLTAAEWPGYSLASDLVVLSACDSGLGPALAGEGVLGLSYALQVAGNANTLLTLWPVDDQATARFVTRLFSRLVDGATPAHALAETQREFARSARWHHPRFWAPFILLGAG